MQADCASELSLKQEDEHNEGKAGFLCHSSSMCTHVLYQRQFELSMLLPFSHKSTFLSKKSLIVTAFLSDHNVF